MEFGLADDGHLVSKSRGAFGDANNFSDEARINRTARNELQAKKDHAIRFLTFREKG
jgi:hypothetical protein